MRIIIFQRFPTLAFQRFINSKPIVCSFTEGESGSIEPQLYYCTVLPYIYYTLIMNFRKVKG